MSLSLQFAVVGIVIACACVYVLRASWRTLFRAQIGCGSGCGTCKATAPEPVVEGRHPLPMA